MPDPKLVAILNVTPDSFSDGGRHFTVDHALAAIDRFIKEGADIIDIGAESTRPGAQLITPEQEWMRLERLLHALDTFTGTRVRFSLDTRHAVTARKALSCGIDYINDVTGFSDPIMIQAVKASNCKLVIMHSLGVPADKSVVMPENEPIIPALLSFAKNRIAELEAAGIARSRIIFDPGLGFGKTAAQSHEIANNAAAFHELKVPILIGHSRKSFLGDAQTRDAATLALSQKLAGQGVHYLRVHDIAAHHQLFAQQKRSANG